MQMQREGKNMFDVRRELGVKSVRQKIEKRVLDRIGHVMRMEDTRLVKAAVLGWMEDLEEHQKVPGKKRKTVLFWKKTLREAALDHTRINTLTSDRKEWRSQVRKRMRHIEEWEKKSGHHVEGERGGRSSPTEEMESSLTCDWEGCGKVCKSKGGLTAHRRRMHEISSEKVKFVCADCKEEFDQEANLKNHKKYCIKLEAEDKTKRKCSNCHGEYKKSYFTKHFKRCTGRDFTPTAVEARVYVGEQYICDGCGRSQAKTNRSRHSRVCPGGGGVH